MTGRITLTKDGKVVQTRRFQSQSEQDKIIIGWKGIYGKGFDKLEMETKNDYLLKKDDPKKAVRKPYKKRIDFPYDFWKE